MADESRERLQRGARCAEVTPGSPQRLPWIDLQPDQSPNGFEGVSEQEARPLRGSEQVADDWERAALNAGEENRRASRSIETALDLGRLQIRIDFMCDPNQVPGALEVIDTLAKGSVSHEGRRWRRKQVAAGNCRLTQSSGRVVYAYRNGRTDEHKYK
jgi:hypothetical protein